MRRYLEYKVQAEAGEEIEVTITSFHKEKATVALVQPKDLPAWRDDSQRYKAARGYIEMTAATPSARLQVPSSGTWYILIQASDAQSAGVSRVPKQ